MAENYEDIIIAGHSFGAWTGMKVGCGDVRVKVERLYSTLPEPKRLIRIEGADHFFTGKLDELSEAIHCFPSPF